MSTAMQPAEAPAVFAPPATLTPHLKLYEATDAIEQVRAWLDESEGELTPEIEALMAEAALDFDLKVERIAFLVRQFEADADVNDAEAKRIRVEADRAAARSKARANAAKSLKAYLLREMTAAERPVVKRPLITVRVQNNSRPSVTGELSEEALRDLAQGRPALVVHVPESFRLDGDAVLAAVKAGEPAPEGVTIVRGQHVRLY